MRNLGQKLYISREKGSKRKPKIMTDVEGQSLVLDNCHNMELNNIVLNASANKKFRFSLEIMKNCTSITLNGVDIHTDLDVLDRRRWSALVPNGIRTLGKHVKINKFKGSGLHTNLYLSGDDTKVYNPKVEDFSGDAIFYLQSNLLIEKARIKKSLEMFPYNVFHRDGIQGGGTSHSRLRNVRIRNCILYFEDVDNTYYRSAQGIVGFDAIHSKFELYNNIVMSDISEHGISFGRLENSTIDSCVVSRASRQMEKIPCIRWGSRKEKDYICRKNTIENCRSPRYDLPGTANVEKGNRIITIN